MKTCVSFLSLGVLSAFPAQAGDLRETVTRYEGGDAKSAPALAAAETPSRWRVGAGYAAILGLKAEFSGLGGFQSPFAPQPVGGGVNYEYDDGFVRVDSSGNAGGQTWNWGYENDAQYNPAGTGSIDFSITSSQADGAASTDADPQSGVEVFTFYDMGAVTLAPLKQLNASWGFRGGLHYSRLDIDSSGNASSTLTTTTDTFDLGGAIPPSAPYEGTFSGPGVLIGDSPVNRAVVTSTQSILGSQNLDVHLTVVDFGAYLNVPVSRKFSVSTEGGLSLAVASGTYDHQSRVSVDGLGTQNNGGSAKETTLLPGMYLGLGATYQIDEHWSLGATGRYQYLRSFELEAGGSEATLSFDSAYVLSLNIVYSF